MEKQGCLNVTLDDQKYSSPMPIIGLYIAAGTFVCVLFMVYDVFHGLCRRKPWIPCKLFSLNSFTLSVLAIASKLPIDLTTPMPSVHDQLSKLSGTVLICVSMCVLFPSLGSQSDSERLSNMLSLSIFVVTVVVNVCMQMVTGVIFLFIVEHVIIMSFMLLLLTVLWSALDIYGAHVPFSNPVDELKTRDPQNSENKSMIHILKSFYKSSSKQSPELVLVNSPVCLAICMLSTLSSLVLLQAALRSFGLKKVDFRCGISDYKWSMWMVLVTQILTVLVGIIVTIFRGLLLLNGLENEIDIKMGVLDISPPFLSKFDSFSTWVSSSLSKLRTISFFKIFRIGFVILFQTIERYLLMVLVIVHFILYILAALLYLMLGIPYSCGKICFGEKRNDEGRVDMDIRDWIERNCEEDIDRWMEKYKRSSPIDNLIQVLSKTSKSAEPFANKVSCLSVVIFVRIATVVLPSSLSATLIHTLEEAFEILYFIEKKEISTTEEKNSLVVAKNLWLNKNNTCHWFHRRFIKPLVEKFYSHLSKESNDGCFVCQPQRQFDCARGFIEQLKERCNDDTCIFLFEEASFAVTEIQNVCELIIRQRPQQTYSSIDGLIKHMEQLFVDMLHFFLSQLPVSIFKHLVESTVKQHEERARLVLKFLCKLEPLEYKVHWSFTDGTGITSLINTQVPVIDTQSTEQVGGNVDADVVQHVTRRVIDSDEIEELV